MSQVILTVGSPSKVRLGPLRKSATVELLRIDRSGSISLLVSAGGDEREIDLRLGESVEVGRRRFENLGPSDDEMGPHFTRCKLVSVH